MSEEQASAGTPGGESPTPSESMLGGAQAPTAPGADTGAPSSEAGPQGEVQTEQKPDAKPEGAPEKYEFKVPDGAQMDTELLGKFEPLAKDLNLSQEKAQQLVDLYADAIASNTKALAEKWAKQGSEWLQEVKADVELGGQHFTETVRNIETAMKRFGSESLTKAIKDMGLDNHPELVRFFSKVGREMSEDKFVGGKSANAETSQKSIAERLYPST